MLNKRDLLAGGGALLALAAAPVRAAAKPATIVQIPLSFDVDNAPMVDLFIGENGPYRFLIDTGSDAALIRENVAKAIKLTSHGIVGVGALAGRPDNQYVYQARDILLGGVFKLPAIDMVGLDKLPKLGCDGVLPASFLTALPAELDFEKAMLRYYFEGAPMDLAGFVKLDAEFDPDAKTGAEEVFVRVKLDGHDLLCLLDTGAGGHLFLSGAYVQNHGLWNHNAGAGESGEAGANGEVVKTRIVKIPNFEFGAVHFDDVWVQLGDPNGSDHMHDQGTDGIIGCDLLRQFTLAFPGRHTIQIKPNGRFSPSAGARPHVHEVFDAKQPVLPFLYRDDRRILLPAQNGDKPPVLCLINTGAAKSAIAPATAQTSGLTAMADGFDGSVLVIDGQWHPPHLVLAPKPALNGRPAAIDLGLDFLTAQASRLDFDLNELTLFPDGTPDLAGYTLFATRQAGDDNRFYITVKVAGVDTLCLVDTDAQATVTMAPRTVKARNLWDAFPDAEHRHNAVSELRLAKMTGLDAGGLHLDMTPVLMVDPSSSEAFPPCDALLGMGFMHRCNWIFTPDGKLYAKPNTFWSS